MENHNTETGNKENKDTVPEKEIITDDIYNWITEKYGAPNETWNGDQIALVADDVVKTFFDKSDSKQAAVGFEISSGIEELESSSTSKLESSSTGDDSDDEEFSSLSEDDREEEAEDDTDEEAEDDTEDDTDDETWSPKTIGTTSNKGATSSSSPSRKKTIVNRGEPVRHCILGLPNPKTCEMIRKKEFRVTKEDVKKQVNDSNEQEQGLAPEDFAARNDLDQALHMIKALHDGAATTLKQCI
ncbi:hypothetical protein Tco_0878916 [Tanacetum coccineum]|uniref:Uncharacterized protein n=1 Tax=Tanacetum coccineum TaxID=301880 RepID=A0ABQ5BZJ9_9ASTR